VSQTYTSDTVRVSHDEITSHTTPSDINVLSAQARWQGIDVTETETTYYEDINEASAVITDSTDDEKLLQNTYPTGPGTFYSYRYEIYIKNTGSKEVSSDDIRWYEGGEFGEVDTTETWGETGDPYILQPGEEIYFLSWRHASIDLSETTYTNYSGETDVYMEFSVDDEITLSYSVLRTGKETTETTYSTTDPYVTRDVDASYDGTLSDGEWSSWQDMTGLVEGTNEFYHNISGSNEAYFEFEYTYEETYPTVQKQFRLYDEDQNAIHTVVLADPSDSQLNYNHHRYALNGTVYALDVVDPSDENAIDWVKWYHPTHGEYCPRAYDTIQL
jgi:archaellum component FlaG (FlaF/FlaG flagellin family)